VVNADKKTAGDVKLLLSVIKGKKRKVKFAETLY
jgi:hypothetical protein